MKMAEKKTEPKVSIDDVSYMLEDLSDESRLLLDHVADLDRKIRSASFNVEQLQVGREAFFARLKESVADTTAEG
jgi:hypothetical protein